MDLFTRPLACQPIPAFQSTRIQRPGYHCPTLHPHIIFVWCVSELLAQRELFPWSCVLVYMLSYLRFCKFCCSKYSHEYFHANLIAVLSKKYLWIILREIFRTNSILGKFSHKCLLPHLKCVVANCFSRNLSRELFYPNYPQ